jgi:hypothetical protein
MRSLGGLVLLAGIGVGLFVYLPAPVDRHTSLDTARRVVAETKVERLPPAPTVAQPDLRTFSPKISLTAMAPPGERRDTTGDWQTSVSSTSGAAQYQSLEPTNPEARYRLIVSIQEQLKRVGCYYGRTDGSWGAGSKYAMQSFMERANSALPIDKPDYVLLTLLQAQSGKVCGECPADQVLSPGGRCAPQATVAYGQPGVEAPAATAPKTATIQKEVLPWQAAGNAAKPAPTQPLFTPLPTSVVSTEPLPGRMAVGAPTALPPVNSVYAPSVTPPADTGQPPVTTATATPPGEPAPAATLRSSQRQSYKRSRRQDGPGTPRYNLLLSLGGAY